MESNIIVSIICNTYNHENYIRDAIESFLMQKTDFAFEVLIHDDASTDGTADIIREYEKKYPNIIKPIYQRENQYSKGIQISPTYQHPRVKGKYIAICEGDDYWIDEFKLQKQVDYMETHSTCTFCFTNAKILSVQNNNFLSFLKTYNKQFIQGNNDYSLGEFVNKFAFIPTCSFFFPFENYSKFPEYFKEYCFGGDRKLSLYSIALGYVHLIDDETGVYRQGVPNSAMTRAKSQEETLKIHKSYINLINNLLVFTKDKYASELNYHRMCKDMLLFNERTYRDLIKNDYYKCIYKLLPIRKRIELKIKIYFPWLLNLKRKLTHKK